MILPRAIQQVINELSQLPGIGPKSAQRLSLYLLNRNQLDNIQFAEAVMELKKSVLLCTICHSMSETELCSVCQDSSRDASLLCVVEEVMDAISMDRSGRFTGRFHVLGGAINPLEGIGPDKLHIASLQNRLEQNPQIMEVILATNPTIEGEATALYLQKILKELPIKITRLARGLPMGGQLEYADEFTLSQALKGRQEV